MPSPLMVLHAMAAALACVLPAAGQLAAAPEEADAPAVVSVPITGDRLGGFVLPTEPGTWPLVLRAEQASAWKVETTQRLYLTGRVSVAMGAYDFTADRAVLWIERIPSAKGIVTQLAIWFPETIEPTKAAGLGAGGSNLFVTASTYGDVNLSAVLFDPRMPPANPDIARAQQRMAAYLGGLAAKPPPIRILPEVLRPSPPPPPPPLVVGGVAPADPSVAAALEVAGQRAATRPLLEFRDLPPAVVAKPQPGEAFDPGVPRPIVAPDSTVAFAAEEVAADEEVAAAGTQPRGLGWLDGLGEPDRQLRDDALGARDALDPEH
ncbi:MAG: hypothetical protein ACKOFI_05140, partial [Phycisphaerales bacterium]